MRLVDGRRAAALSLHLVMLAVLGSVLVPRSRIERASSVASAISGQTRKFELVGNKTIYHYLGVDFYKRNLLLTDLVMFRFRKKKQFNSNREYFYKELERLYWQTCRDESIHYVFMIIIAIYSVISFSALSLWQFVLFFFINLYSNVYPVFVQRHNRVRYERLLGKHAKLSAQ